ncbi:MAG: sugar nucleotide-binding protein [Nanoarchaeota archaeon]|nr:sugar nucleotide-binding protein [Nanoarchaeota archaeon]
MTVKYLIFGDGYLGNKFGDFLDDSLVSKTRIETLEDARKEIAKHDPEFVINCMGKTGVPNVDWCEDNKTVTFMSNVIAPIYLALASKEIGKTMVHIGSGCEYEGEKGGEGFSETDEPNFSGSIYSISKIISEKILGDFDNVLQLRIRMPLDDEPNQRNLITKLLGYKKVLVMPNSITYVQDLLQISKKLMHGGHKGIFNVVNKGAITHDEILKKYQEFSGKDLNFETISSDELDKMTKAKRSNCVLSTRKLESFMDIPSSEDAVERCLKEYVKNEKLGGSLS